MKIAILGWGSLIWDPRFLATVGKWQPDGPQLPIEFARISRSDRLTLVLLEGANPIRTYWTVSAEERLDAARENLRAQEGKGVKLAEIGYMTRDGCGWFVPFGSVASFLLDWLEAQPGLDALIWTGLPSNFPEKTGNDFSIQSAIQLLGQWVSQNRHFRAEEYIRKAPEQSDTTLRKRVRVDFGWTDSNPSETT